MLAKLVTWGPDRNAAVRRLERALSEYAIAGIQTNIAFFREILNDPEFLAGNLSTEFIADFLARRKPRGEPSPDLDVAVALAALAHFERGRERTARALKADASRWLTAGRGRLLR